MLKRLTVENYALIDTLEMSWEPGFTIITGETGAGKSILLGALSLILGQRADAQVLMDAGRKCIVEGEFEVHGYGLEPFFSRYDLDADDRLLLRREINAQGKSRAFINDTPVTLNILKELAVLLIDIHSQHQSLDINHAAFQVSVIDSFGQQQAVVKTYAEGYNKLKDTEKHLKELQVIEVQQKKDQDYYRFLFDELDAAALRAGEMQELEAEMTRLTHAGNIQEALSKSCDLFSDSEENILLKLSQVQQLLSQAARYDDTLKEPSDRVQGILIEAKEIAHDVEQKAEKVLLDPERTEKVSARLDMLYRLLQKHHVQFEAELIAVREELDQKLLQIHSIEQDIAKVQEEVKRQTSTLQQTATQLSAGRKKCIPVAEKKLVTYLKNLGMPQAQIKILCEPLEDFSATGKDHIQFLFNANKGGELQELNHVASGGEISRLMLAVKSLISQKNLLPTIIFDEIDSGVSGEVAGKVGEILTELSGQMQVIAITHLPQIAARGDQHLLVYKKTDHEKTRTYLKLLNHDERIHEIAQMIGGLNVTEKTRETAKELIEKQCSI